MDSSEEHKSALSIQEGVPQPPSVNPELSGGLVKRKKKRYSTDEFVSGILDGNRTMLSQAITLVESSLHAHYEKAQQIIEACLPHSGKSVRIGITGVPGAGKSTFIESFGNLITKEGRKIAVLAIDPSSSHSNGSILGDKTRMESLSTNPGAFIRPSPSAGTLGGVSRKTREIIILCEAAGFDTVLVETVGVGQSETEVSSMVDIFLLLMLAGAGDELQGIKRGIMEMADVIAVTKADGSNRIFAEGARVNYQNALMLFSRKPSGWQPRVLTCSALEKKGIAEIWNSINEYVGATRESGYFDLHRREQAVIRMHSMIAETLKNSFYDSAGVKNMMPLLEEELQKGRITSYKAAQALLDKYFGRCS